MAAETTRGPGLPAISPWLMAVELVVRGSVDRKAFDDWYDSVHLPEIMSCPGFISGVRFIDGRQETTSGDRRDLTLYEVSGPSVLRTPEFEARRGLAGFAHDVRATVRMYQRHDSLSRGHVLRPADPSGPQTPDP